jgi:hypothetical protein
MFTSRLGEILVMFIFFHTQPFMESCFIMSKKYAQVFIQLDPVLSVPVLCLFIKLLIFSTYVRESQMLGLLWTEINMERCDSGYFKMA